MVRKKKSYKTGDILHTEGKAINVNDTLYVSMPKAWAKEHNIKAGDVMVKVANSILTIAPKFNKP